VIRARTLEVKLQRSREKLEVTFGECILDVGDDPNAEVADAAQAAGKSRRSSVGSTEAEAKPADGGRASAEESEERGQNHRSVPPPS